VTCSSWVPTPGLTEAILRDFISSERYKQKINLRSQPRPRPVVATNNQTQPQIIEAPAEENNASQFLPNLSEPGIVTEDIDGMTIKKRICGCRILRKDACQLLLKWLLPGRQVPCWQLVGAAQYRTGLEGYMRLHGFATRKEAGFKRGTKEQLKNVVWMDCDVGGIAEPPRDT